MSGSGPSVLLAIALIAASAAPGRSAPGPRAEMVLERADGRAFAGALEAGRPFRMRVTLRAGGPFPVRVQFPSYYCIRGPTRPAPSTCSVVRAPAGVLLRCLDPEMAELADDAPVAFDVLFEEPPPAGELVEVLYEGSAPELALSPAEPGYQPIICRRLDAEGRPAEELARLSPAVVAGAASKLRLVAPSSARPGESFAVRAVALDAYGNPAMLPAAPLRLAGVPDATRVRIERPGVYRLEGTAGELRGRTNPILVSAEGPRIVFGDLHVHSGEASRDAYGSAELAYRYGRDVAGLDFVARTDHDGDLTASLWERSRRLAAEWTRPGHFVALLGFEWTPAYSWGHRSVIFPGSDGEIVRCGEPAGDRPEELWSAVARHGGLALPHLPSAEPFEHHRYDWDRHNAHLEPVVEIDSQWRAVNERLMGRDAETNPEGVQRGLARGYRFGIIAGSDNHTAMPGRTGGLAGMRVRSLDAAGLWEAMRAKRTFGTSGERMIVGLEGGRRLRGVAHGTGPLARVEIVKGWKGAPVPFQVAHALDMAGREDAYLEWEDPEALSGGCYYLRAIQRDGEKAWTSPVWVDGEAAPPAPRPASGVWRDVPLPRGLEVRPLEVPSAHEWRPLGEGAFEVTKARWTGPSETARTLAFRVMTPLFELEEGARYRLSCELEGRGMIVLMDERWANAGRLGEGEFVGRKGRVRVVVFFPAAQGRYGVRRVGVAKVETGPAGSERGGAEIRGGPQRLEGGRP